jgi:hypothetical protein
MGFAGIPTNGMALGLGSIISLFPGSRFPPLLDQLGVASAAAYSLRRLRAAYTGSATRVRRSSDNAELDFGFATAVQTRTNLAAIPINNSGSSTPPGVTMTVTGTGTEFGQPYVEVRWQGTAASDFFLQWTHSPYGNFNVLDHAPIAAGLTYSSSFGYRLVAGTAPAGTWVRRALIWDATGSHPGTGHPAAATPTPSLDLQRPAVIFTAPVGSSYAQPNLYVLITLNEVVDCTIRFYAANVELGTGNARPLLQRNVPEVVADVGGLDAEALLTFVGGGSGFVPTWYDQSGNGRNDTQPTAGAQPRIVNNGAIETQNGRPLLVVSGQQFMLSTLTVAQAVAEGVVTTLSAVFQSAQGVQATLLTAQFLDGGNAYNIHAPWLDGNTYFDVLGITPRVNGPLTWDELSVGSFVRNGALAEVYKNGEVAISSNNNPTSGTRENQPFMLFAYQSENPIYQMVGGAAEMIFFPSTTARQLLERNQGAYYNITVA